MKRKQLFGMLAAVGITLTTSCSNDAAINPSSNEAQVVFSLDLENAINTRVISDGSGINQLHYAIFSSEGDIVKSSRKGNDEVSDEANNDVEFPLTESLTLVKGRKYTAVFWAYNKECTAYSISDDMTTITVDYDNALNNDETRDAFYKSETFTVTDDMNLNVILKRPFAQLNVGITTEEWENAKAQGLEITKSEVEIKQAATTINLLDGTVSGAVDVTFVTNTIPDEYLMVDVDCDGEQETYKYLSMCYFLANDETNGSAKTTLDDLKFTFSTEDESSQMILEEGLDNAPVQRNHRTNIISAGGIGGGGILTGDLTVEVTLDPLYDGEHTLCGGVWEEYEGIYTEEALAGKTIELPAGWHIRNGYILEPMPEYWTSASSPLYTKSYTVDGNGNTVTFEPYNYNFVAKNVFAAANGQLVTVKNITFEGEHSGVFGGVCGGVTAEYKTLFENMIMVNNGVYCYNDAGSIPMSAFTGYNNATLTNCAITGTYWVGAEKDKNTNAQTCLDTYGIYDIFVPNKSLITLNSCTIGSVYIQNQGKLTLSGNSKVEKIIGPGLIKSVEINISGNTEVTLLDIDKYSDAESPTLIIEAGSTIETLQLNSVIIKDKVKIDDNATITKIIHKGVEYSSIADFKAANP